jgi:hypothetical protein
LVALSLIEEISVNEKAPPVKIPAVILFGKDRTSKPHASFFLEGDLAAAVKAAELMKMRVLLTDTEERRAVAAELPQGRIFQASGRAFVPFVSAQLYRRLVALAAGGGLGLPGDPNHPRAAEPTPNRGVLGQFSTGQAMMALAAPAVAPGSFFGRGATEVPRAAKNAPAATPDSNKAHLGPPEGAEGASIGKKPVKTSSYWPSPATTRHQVTAPKKPYYGRPGTGDRPRQAAQMARPKRPQVTAAGMVVLASVGAGEGWWEADVLEVHDDLLTLQWRDCPDEPSFVRRKSQIALLFPTVLIPTRAGTRVIG